MKLLVAVAAVLAVASCASELCPDDQEFSDWKLLFNKTYSGPDEEAQHKLIWLSTRKEVYDHNVLADHEHRSFRLGLNQFSDREIKEHRRIIFDLPEPEPTVELLGGNDTEVFIGNVTEVFIGNVTELASRGEPSTVDWRLKGFVTDVKDQKECNAGWAFSATGSLEGQHFKATDNLVSLSEQELVDCSRGFGNLGCGGGQISDAFDYIKSNNGINGEDTYPYEATEGHCRGKHLVATMNNYMHITSGSEHALKTAVYKKGPVSVSIDASHSSFRYYRSGVYYEPNCSRTFLTHSVLVVGYGTIQGKDYWLVKNSWGVNWGNKGYIMMSRNKRNQCGIATAAMYPLV